VTDCNNTGSILYLLSTLLCVSLPVHQPTTSGCTTLPAEHICSMVFFCGLPVSVEFFASLFARSSCLLGHFRQRFTLTLASLVVQMLMLFT